jgi:alpha-D-ribose 1-methylphosphonate 5-triphosphate synthase subunit PhnH
MAVAAFPEPVLASQAVFRAVMDAFARPGAVRPLPPAPGAPPPLSATAAAVALALLDYETPVWLDAALSSETEVADWIRMATGARVTNDPREAAFALIASPALTPAFDVFAVGSAEYPDRSTTLVLQVDRFGSGERLSLSGPGVKHTQGLASEPLPPDFPARLAANRALFPCGVDVILVSPTAVAALPRSVSVAPEKA